MTEQDFGFIKQAIKEGVEESFQKMSDNEILLAFFGPEDEQVLGQ